jgi:outer membrane biosynthesis protein TonB
MAYLADIRDRTGAIVGTVRTDGATVWAELRDDAHPLLLELQFQRYTAQHWLDAAIAATLNRIDAQAPAPAPAPPPAPEPEPEPEPAPEPEATHEPDPEPEPEQKPAPRRRRRTT